MGALSVCKTWVLSIVEVRVLICPALFSISNTMHMHPHMCHLYVLVTLHTFNNDPSPSSSIYNFCPAGLGSYLPSTIFSLLGFHPRRTSPSLVSSFSHAYTCRALSLHYRQDNGLSYTFPSLTFHSFSCIIVPLPSSLTPLLNHEC